MDATFADGVVRGSILCNSYGATYSTTSDDQIAIGGLAGTLVGCADDVNAVASAYTSALTHAVSFEVSGDELTLRDADGQVSVRFASGAGPEIVGLTWEVASSRNRQIDEKQAMVNPTGSTITA